jgi:glucose-1-phosphate cytidylyltransferase
MRQLAGAGELVAYRHDGFWHSMDTLRDRAVLEELWAGGSPPWRVWETPARSPRAATVALSLTAV